MKIVKIMIADDEVWILLCGITVMTIERKIAETQRHRAVAVDTFDP